MKLRVSTKNEIPHRIRGGIMFGTAAIEVEVDGDAARAIMEDDCLSVESLGGPQEPEELPPEDEASQKKKKK